MSLRHIAATFIATLVLALVHLASGRIRLTEEGRFIRSFFAGMALSYVFMHVLPELASYQAKLVPLIRHRLWPWFDEHVYLFCMLGLICFYVMKGLADRKDAQGRRTNTAFRYDLLASSLHAALTGYVFAYQRALAWPLLLITVAFGAHYWSSDRALLERYGDRYRQGGARLLAAVILAGWAFGVLVSIPRQLLTAIYAFLSGGLVMNAIRGELPGESAGNYAALCLGAAFYTALGLWIYSLVS